MNPQVTALVTMLFVTFSDLFLEKAKNRGLVIYQNDRQEENTYSETFLFWCRKLNGLTARQFHRGIAKIEARAKTMYLNGAEMWPPSYAEFIAVATEDRDTRAHRHFDQATMLENKTLRENQYEIGLQRCSILMKILEDQK